MFMTISGEKGKLREEIRAKAANESDESKRLKSESITQKLLDDPLFQNSKALMFYVSIASEVETLPLIKKALKVGKRIVVPYIDKKSDSLVPVEIKDPLEDLAPGSYGILEPRAELVRPFDINQLELVLVPGLAFDRLGHRLGRGKGYYDCFLNSLPVKVKRYGLCFDFQLFDVVPFNSRDVSVDRVITNN
jgi:5-formyltetrahydrofolate cyclo-ligase